jgi:hypothetical protein
MTVLLSQDTSDKAMLTGRVRKYFLLVPAYCVEYWVFVVILVPLQFKKVVKM